MLPVPLLPTLNTVLRDTIEGDRRPASVDWQVWRRSLVAMTRVQLVIGGGGTWRTRRQPRKPPGAACSSCCKATRPCRAPCRYSRPRCLPSPHCRSSRRAFRPAGRLRAAGAVLRRLPHLLGARPQAHRRLAAWDRSPARHSPLVQVARPRSPVGRLRDLSIPDKWLASLRTSQGRSFRPAGWDRKPCPVPCRFVLLFRRSLRWGRHLPVPPLVRPAIWDREVLPPRWCR